MCLAVPARIVKLDGETALIDISGVRRHCNVLFVEDPEVGDYVLVHAGFAIRKWSRKDLREYQEILGEPSRSDQGAGRSKRGKTNGNRPGY